MEDGRFPLFPVDRAKKKEYFLYQHIIFRGIHG
jgi:hypothetical protein